MPIRLDRSYADDRPAILALMDEARGRDLSDAERAQQGFVQGRMDESSLTRLQAGTGVFVARDGATLVGFAMTSAAHSAKNDLAVEMLRIAAQAESEVQPEKTFLYGPVAVDRRYQGQGLLTRLLIHVCTELRTQFKLGVLFIDRANHKSLTIHREYLMDERSGFEFKGRSYVVFTFSPAAILDHYG